MDSRLLGILEMLLANVHTLNEEVARLGRCEQFIPAAESFQLIERIREACLSSLQNARTIERRLTIEHYQANSLKEKRTQMTLQDIIGQ